MSPSRQIGRTVAERAAPKALAVAIACLTGSLAAPAFAEEAANSGRRIEEVIVTAERREAYIQDTSISITALTGDFMDDFGVEIRKISKTSYLPPRFSPTTQPCVG